MDLPLYFPTDYNRRLAGFVDPFRKKFKIVFQDFGRYGHVDVSFPVSPLHDCGCHASISMFRLNTVLFEVLL